MSKKFKKVEYPRQLLETKTQAIILRFLDQYEADICYEEMTSEIVKTQMANALADYLIENGLTMTYMKVAADDNRDPEEQ